MDADIIRGRISSEFLRHSLLLTSAGKTKKYDKYTENIISIDKINFLSKDRLILLRAFLQFHIIVHKISLKHKNLTENQIKEQQHQSFQDLFRISCSPFKIYLAL